MQENSRAPIEGLYRLPPEAGIILSLLKPEIDTGHLDYLLNQGIDWDKAVAFGKKQGVLPLLHSVIDLAADPIKASLPKDFLARCKEYYETNLWRVLKLWRSFLGVFDYLCAENIEVIPLKGIIFAQHFYTDPAVRPIFADIDMLVHRDDANPAVELLKQRGYQLSSRSEDNSLCLKGADGTRLEFHTELMPEWLNRISSQSLWERSKSYEIDGRKIRLLSEEDTLLTYPLQIRFHLPQLQLFRFLDLDRILRKNYDLLNRGYIFSKARDYHSYNSLLFTLLICRRIFATPLPKKSIEIIERSRLLSRLYYRLFEKHLLLSFEESPTLISGHRGPVTLLLKALLIGNIQDGIAILSRKRKKDPVLV